MCNEAQRTHVHDAERDCNIPRDDRVSLQFDSAQVAAVLNILDKIAQATPVDNDDWQDLYAAEPYIRLKEREVSINRPFTDTDFKSFLLSSDTQRQRVALKHTLAAWCRLPLSAIGVSTLDYLPAHARIRARLFPVIKPAPNSFVHGASDDAMVFLYLDPTLRMPQVEALIVHELHHIGLYPFECESNQRQDLRPPVRRAVGFMRDFREGYAMLAAAGGSDVHPRHLDGAAERALWDRAMNDFGHELKAIESFLLDVVNERLAPAQSERIAMEFLGRQGPWYTVGWRMAAMVERRFGRDLLIDCMSDPRLLLLCYNSAAVIAGRDESAEEWPIWSMELMRALVPSRRETRP
ncbi:hypothetical protein ABIF38_002975 [Bradyrhizobium japonicum]|jgi:hypothetical protein|uniref:DUF2268 domain-containing protein n=2 Tax=Bradyrhizobium elkanii TaxID=29448 RepID=A0ABV4FE85_BRAEL|nr:DUF5700 domain-containing putative Zn-dependent protease [Bradyrhizobium elkanii]MBP2431659.1 hypothetical protein [Bradyrhizobium elkanii]MCP1734710.1 hypothetical protein [Bradyrhizobium elkanii]MCP1752812.1 hypothetical protein [Bradyrhizobium elkanii]MCP1966321.1 hypothetical protein [Bradyrhizobium elkanii]MCS3522483.1 hypothetical protein [Bradyrhizobium elkanii]